MYWHDKLDILRFFLVCVKAVFVLVNGREQNPPYSPTNNFLDSYLAQFYELIFS